MTPAEFAEVVVFPTVQDYFALSVDRRVAYLSCIATYALVDYVARAENTIAPPRRDVLETLRATAGPAFGVVHGVCNGTKHAKGKTRFMPGDERVEPSFGFAEAQSYVNGQPTVGGFGQASFGVPRPYIVEDGKSLILDSCVRVVLLALVAAYPRHLGTVDVAGLNLLQLLECWKRKTARCVKAFANLFRTKGGALWSLARPYRSEKDIPNSRTRGKQASLGSLTSLPRGQQAKAARRSAGATAARGPGALLMRPRLTGAGLVAMEGASPFSRLWLGNIILVYFG